MKTGVKIGLGIAAVAAAFLAWKKFMSGKPSLLPSSFPSSSQSSSQSGLKLLVPPDSLPADFDEQAYLALNPDVAYAVTLPNNFKSGGEHYLRAGYSEGRKWKSGMGSVSYLLR
jgi:hypothetical protein